MQHSIWAVDLFLVSASLSLLSITSFMTLFTWIEFKNV